MNNHSFYAIITLFFQFLLCGCEGTWDKSNMVELPTRLPPLSEVTKIEASNRPMCLTSKNLWEIEIDDQEQLQKIYQIFPSKAQLFHISHKTYILFQLVIFKSNGEIVNFDFYYYSKCSQKAILNINNKYYLVPIAELIAFFMRVGTDETKLKIEQW